MSEQDETAPVLDEAPVAETAAPGETEAPASPPEGYIEQSRYDNLRAEHNRKQALWDRAQQGDLNAMRELQLPVQFEDEEYTAPEDGEEPAYQDPRVDALLQERAQERDQAILRDAQGHVASLFEEAGVEIDPAVQQDLVMRSLGRSGGVVGQMNGETTAEVVKEYIAADKAREQAAIDRYLKSKRSTHVSPGGTGATETPYRDDMSLRELTRAAQEQAKLASEM